ncbi:MAG: hypothetical protein OEW88_06770 [Gammaproteobacteria bacterium]|nr:hypothetical protein [Gammaproteobacteria bacterium]MDH5276109.1 hypothetical protein [Gammaproteobacteria bacterium]
MNIKSFLFAFLPLTWTAVSAPAHAMPYCALRDPAHQLFDMYPLANTYRSIVHTVDDNARASVSAALPFTLHARELGEHTLYVPLQKTHSLGIVHVRTEPGEWGLVEIAWALDLDLRVRDFRFQRCRGPGCDTLPAGAFLDLLRGRQLPEIRELLSDDGTALRNRLPGVSADEQALAVTVLRSAAKTIAVTGTVWGVDIARLN